MKPPFRHAEASDIAFISRLLREFYQKQCDIYQIPFDYPSTVLTVGRSMIHGVCLVGPSSCAGAILGPFPFNHHAIVAMVPFWYFRRPKEIEILAVLISECRAMGATHINVASHFPKNTISRYYSKRGIIPCETQHLGKILLADEPEKS
jgi:hypothetical protein